MGRNRATRKARASDGVRDLEFDALKAENLQLKEEIERLRLRNAGAHPAAALADALLSSDDAGDNADDALTMFASSMVIRSELIELLALFKSTIQDYERRLEMLTEGPSTGVHAADDDLEHLDDADEIDLTVGADTDHPDDLDEIDLTAADDDIDETFTIDLRDSENVTSVSGVRHNGTAVGHHDEDTAPTAKGA